MAKMQHNEEFFINKLEDSFSRESDIQKYLQKTSADYRFLEPGRLLYEMAMKVSPKERFNEHYIELVYVTLKAWNMNSRGAKLSDYKAFSRSIKKNKASFDKLQSKQIQNFDEIDPKLLSDLYGSLKLTETKSKIVTFSKALHFFLPNLVVPIDRKFTLSFFQKNIQYSICKDEKRFDKKQFDAFMNIEKAFSVFIQKHNLSKYRNDGWNQNIPKILDNLIIGYKLSNEEG